MVLKLTRNNDGIHVELERGRSETYSDIDTQFHFGLRKAIVNKYDGYEPFKFDVLVDEKLIGNNLNVDDAIRAFCFRYASNQSGIVSVEFSCKGVAPEQKPDSDISVMESEPTTVENVDILNLDGGSSEESPEPKKKGSKHK